MKNMFSRTMKGERGKVLILVLVLLVLGGLVLTPLLGLASTGLTAGEIYERKMYEYYAADAGVENALWKLRYELPLPCPGDAPGWEYPNDGDPPFEFELNDKNVNVIIEYVENDGEGGFKITSTATGDDGSSTTIVSYVQGTYVEATETVEDGSIWEGSITNTTVYAEGDLHVTGSIEYGAVVYVEGGLTVDTAIEDNAQVYVKGDVTLTGVFGPGNIEDTVVICVGGDLTLGHCSENGVEVYVEGNLIAEGVENGAKICIEGDATIGKIEDDDDGIPTVCVGGLLTVDEEIEGGYIYYPDFTNPSLSPANCPMCCEECGICCECPLEWPTLESGYWSELDIANYNINP